MPIVNSYTTSQRKWLADQILHSSSTTPTLTPRTAQEVNGWFLKNYVFIDCSNDAVRGWVIREPLDNDFVEVKALYVFPEYRRQGVANRLLAATTEQTRQPISTYIAASRVNEVQTLLERSGFKKIRLTDLPVGRLIRYLQTRKISSILTSVHTKIDIYIKYAN